jgi:phage gp29-like protein
MLLPKIPPEQIRAWMLSASQGNFYSAYSLFSVMEDTWVRLRKNLHEIRESASRVKYLVQPFAIEGEEPTETAIEKAHLFAHALKSFSPDPATDEKGLEGTVYDLCSAMVAGITVQEILWKDPSETDTGMWEPRATAFVFTPRIGFTQDRKIGVVQALATNDYWQTTSAQDLDPNKYLVAQYQTRSGPVTTYGLLRPLAWWWGAMMYGKDWLMKYAQIFGQPIRWCSYPPGTSPDTIVKIETLLAQMGSCAYAAMPDGVKIEFVKDSSSTQTNPQIILQDMGDKYADLMILGQTLTSDVADSGSRALGQVHENTKQERVMGLAAWCAAGPLDQLARAWCRINYGDEKEVPVVMADTSRPEDPVQMAQRDQILLSIPGFVVPRQWMHNRHGVPVPKEGDEIIEGQQPAPVGFQKPEVTPETEAGQETEAETGKNKPKKEAEPKEKKEESEETVTTREMIKAAGGNGDRQNRILRFESIPIQSNLPPTSGGTVRLQKDEAAATGGNPLESPVARATLEDTLKAFSATNTSLIKRVNAMRSLSDQAFSEELRAMADEFPEITKQCFASPGMKDATESLAGGISAEVFNGLSDKAELKTK